jgi:hypothetical protein
VSTLTVVYLTSTGNVMAALTRAAPPGAGEAVTALVGTSLPVRGVGLTSAHFAFPASLLAAATVNDTLPDAVIDPQAFQVIQDPQGKTVQVQPYPPATLTTPAVSLILDTAKGAVVTLNNVTAATSLQAAVVLQNVTTTPPQAARVLAPVTVTGGTSGTVVAAPTDFGTSQTWEFSAFVPGMPPVAISQAL